MISIISICADNRKNMFLSGGSQLPVIFLRRIKKYGKMLNHISIKLPCNKFFCTQHIRKT
jgi:hypothetical protein